MSQEMKERWNFNPANIMFIFLGFVCIGLAVLCFKTDGIRVLGIVPTIFAVGILIPTLSDLYRTPNIGQ